MTELEPLFKRLEKSQFRSRFHLRPSDFAYLKKQGGQTIRQHAQQFVASRLSAAEIANDGKQTPYRGHPVFIAQHATACCCRGCLQKWHGIEAGRALSEAECQYIVRVLMYWLKREWLLREPGVGDMHD